MSGYRKKPDKIADPGPLLGRLRTCRDDLLHAAGEVKPFGVTYHGLSMVVVAIDALAKVLTGQRDYYRATSPGATDSEIAAWRSRTAAERQDAD